MSLINQMLHDLQQRKKSAPQTRPNPPRPRKQQHIPSLPLPLVLGGIGLGVICLVWWLAGALSDVMFNFEPAAKPAASQQVATAEQAKVEDNAPLLGEEQEGVTSSEPEIEPPVVAAEIVPARESAPADTLPVPLASADEASAVPLVAVEPVPVVVRPKPVSIPPRASMPVRKAPPRPLQTAQKATIKTPQRLHPDELPGAILSLHSSPDPDLAETVQIARPFRTHATTPYGRAEEAYLDGKWALEQGHSNLAARSLQHALEVYPGHLPARELLTEIFTKDGKTGEAMFLLAEGLEIAPDYMVFKKGYSRLLVDQGDYDAAAKVMLREGLPTVEEDPEAHVLLASLYQHLGEPFLAAQTYRNLLVYWPQTGAFWVGLGGSLEAQNLPQDAAECYGKALKTKNLRRDLSLYAQKRLELLR